MTRGLDTDTATAVASPSVYLVWLIRLDIASDPVYINSSLTDIFFAGGMGYDAPLVGFTFLGMGNIGTIEPITDSQDGSQALNLILPGVDLTMDYLHQLISNGDLWQRRQAWVWGMTVDSTGAMLGKPFRVKTARMDQMPINIDPESGKGTLTVTLESQNAYSGEALYSRWIDQTRIDSTDTSQKYVADLANRVPEIGNTRSNASSGSSGTNPYGTGFGNIGRWAF